MKALFATDLSEANLAALDCLCECQRDDFEEIVLLHVVDVDMYTEGGSLPLFLETDRALLEKSAGRLRGRGLNVRTRVEQGRVVHEIDRIAAEEGAGLIILGNVGRGGVMGRMLGGTAEAIASSAHTPVLIERVALEAGLWCRMTGGHTFRRTLVAIDFSPASRAALDTAGCMAGLEGLRLIHVKGGREAVDLGSVLERQEKLKGWAREAPGSVRAESEVREGDPVQEVMAAANDWDASCIAAGLCGHGPIERLRWGSVSAGLARTAKLPVLLVPPVS